MDWAQELIEDIKEKDLAGFEATDRFCIAYKDGDSTDAWEKLEKESIQKEDFEGYILLLFEDGSCFAEWNEGTDKFYSHVGDLEAEDDDVEKRLSPYLYDEDNFIEARWTPNGSIEYRVKERNDGWQITPLQEHPGESVLEWLP